LTTDSEIRIYKRLDDPFARVPVALLADDRLTWKAKGIASYLLGKPTNWHVRITDLVNRGRDGRDAVYAGMKELRDAGYMGKRVVRRADGTVERTDYLLSDYPAFKDDKPIDEPLPAFPDLDKPGLDKPTVSKKEGQQRQIDKKNVVGYDIEEDDDSQRPPPGLSIKQLRVLLFPLFNYPVHHAPSRLEMEAELAADGKLASQDAPSLVRWQKLPRDSKVEGAITRKLTYRTLLENIGEQAALATRAFPPAKPAAAPVAAPAPAVQKPEPTPAELQAIHERNFRDKVRAGLGRMMKPPVSPDRADDPKLEIPPRPG
jgi:hypothetical protein